jgi:hypothetical protein
VQPFNLINRVCIARRIRLLLLPLTRLRANAGAKLRAAPLISKTMF